MLNTALSPLIASDPPTNMDVIALAWGSDVPVSLAVDGHLDLSEEFNLWTSRLHVAVHDGDKPTLQAGAVPSWVYIPKEEPAWYSGPPSARKSLDPYADFMFRLPAGTKPDSLGLKVPVGSSSQSNIDLMAYNTTKGQWDRLGNLGNTQQSTNFVTSIPNPTDYTGPAGDVTIRLMSTSGRTDLDLGAVELSLNAP